MFCFWGCSVHTVATSIERAGGWEYIVTLAWLTSRKHCHPLLFSSRFAFLTNVASVNHLALFYPHFKCASVTFWSCERQIASAMFAFDTYEPLWAQQNTWQRHATISDWSRWWRCCWSLKCYVKTKNAPEISIVTVSQTQDSVKLRNVILHRKMYKFRDLFLNLLNKATQAQHFIWES